MNASRLGTKHTSIPLFTFIQNNIYSFLSLSLQLGLDAIQCCDFRNFHILHDRGHDLARDEVRIRVRARPAVLEVPASLRLRVPPDAYGRAAVGHAEAELVDARGLELAGEAQLVPLAVDGDVLLVLRPELVYRLLDDAQPPRLPHALRRHVRVHAGAVPVPLDDRLGMEGAVDLEFLAHPLEDVPRHLQLVPRVDADARPDLVLLLAGHDLAVRPGYVEPRVQARAVHGVGDGAAVGVLGAGRAVVRALRAVGHAALGPTQGGALVEVEEGEFLLEAEPNLLVVASLEGLGGWRGYVII